MTLPPHAEEALARSVMGPSLDVRRGETVTVETWSHALPWALALVRESRRRGAQTILVLEEESTFFASLRIAPARAPPRTPVALARSSDVYVYLPGPEELHRLAALGPRDLPSAIARHGPEWWDAARHRGMRVVRLVVAAANPAAAEHYGVELEPWRREILRASLFPPGTLRRKGSRLVRRLARARRIRVRHANGTDLTFRIAGGSATVEDGRADAGRGHLATQVPSGLVAVRPAPGTVEGVWETNRRTYLRFQQPPAAIGGRFVFRRGRLQEYSFDQGGAAFAAGYADAGRGRDIPSRLTFGLNPAIRGAPEVEELAEGILALWLGWTTPKRGPRVVPFSFPALLAGATIELDGRRWWREGRIVRSAVVPAGPASRA